MSAALLAAAGAMEALGHTPASELMPAGRERSWT